MTIKKPIDNEVLTRDFIIEQRIKFLKIERFNVQGELDDYGFQVNIASMNHNEEKERLYFELKRSRRQYLDEINKEITKLSNIQRTAVIADGVKDLTTDNSLSCESSQQEFVSESQDDVYVEANVPFLAKFILIQSIPNKSYRDNVLGDLHEEFLQNIAEHGALRAKIIYWSHAIRSLPWGFVWLMVKFIMKMR